MERKDALKNIQKLKELKHQSVTAYKHTAKVLEYILYEIDLLRDQVVEAPSIYGSYAGEPNYDDYGEDANSEGTVELVELDDVKIEEKAVKVEEDDDYIDDKNVPLVLAYAVDQRAFQVEAEEIPPAEDKSKDEEVCEEPPRGATGGEVGWTDPDSKLNITVEKAPEPEREKPKKLKIVGEKEKTALHKEGLKRVKDALKSTKKRSKKRSKKKD